MLIVFRKTEQTQIRTRLLIMMTSQASPTVIQVVFAALPHGFIDKVDQDFKYNEQDQLFRWWFKHFRLFVKELSKKRLKTDHWECKEYDVEFIHQP